MNPVCNHFSSNFSVSGRVKLAGFTVNEACLWFCLTVFNSISLISASVFSVHSPAAIRGLYNVTANANQTIHSSCRFKLKAFDCYWETITGNKICSVSPNQARLNIKDHILSKTHYCCHALCFCSTCFHTLSSMLSLIGCFFKSPFLQQQQQKRPCLL